MSSVYEVTHDDVSASSPLVLPERGPKYVLTVFDPLSGAFEVDIQHSDGVSPFRNLYWDHVTKVNIQDTGTPSSVEVPPGKYRMNIVSHTNELTFRST